MNENELFPSSGVQGAELLYFFGHSDYKKLINEEYSRE